MRIYYYLCRCIVYSTSKGWNCSFNQCVLVQEARMRSQATCKSPYACIHIASVKAHRSIQLCLSPSVLESFTFPKEVKATFLKLVNEGVQDTLIKLVSVSSYAIRDFTDSSAASFGLVHVRMDKDKKSFHCTCSAYKRPTSLASSSTAAKLSKRCAHFYAVIWAILSCEELQHTFGYLTTPVNGNFNDY